MTKLDEIVANISGRQVYIQTHNFPDPDAVASAYGLQKLLETRGISSVICYKGKVGRGSTRNLVERLKIHMLPMDELDMSRTDEIILVDAQKGNANIIDLIGDETICIDHHPTYEKVNYRYSDIREEVGACASIIASYYYEEGMELPSDVATALMYGLKIDTANMTRGVSNLDLDVFYRLYKKCDNDLMSELDSSRLCFDDLRAYAAAIGSISIYESLSFAGAGDDCPEALLATISDFVLVLDEVNLSVVYSIKADGIKLSVRSDCRWFDAGRITNEALQGLGNGGGHPTMAGGFVPFQSRMATEVLLCVIKERFIEVMRFHS